MNLSFYLFFVQEYCGRCSLAVAAYNNKEKNFKTRLTSASAFRRFEHLISSICLYQNSFFLKTATCCASGL